nr:tryptophan 2,3-dioxygenase family protein [Dactylosporangium roseum]
MVSGPRLDFPDQVPYDAYVHASTLHSLQQPLSKDPGEMSFLMVSQVMELWFGLARHELREAQRLLREDDVWGALAPLRRTRLHLEGLVAAWNGLRWMTPSDFNRFRDLLGEASGFQSAMYRHLEFLLGLKNEALIRPFKRQADLHDELAAALAAPSLWDDVTAVLARRGFDIPAEVLTAGHAGEYVPSPAVERAWVEIYRDDRADNPLYLLGEVLADVAEEFGLWRYKHLTAVQRTMGNKIGSGGSSGAAWLTRSMGRVVFPELWSARTVI